ncbi:cupin domain-containing protein [Nostoc sp. NIES-2111]
MKIALCAASRAVLVGALYLGAGSIVRAEPPRGVTPNVIGRSTFDAFKLQSDQQAMDFSAQAKAPLDIIVRTHDYAPGRSTGWHSHPGPILIQVIEGQVTFYERDDPSCTPKVVSKGQGYVDTGKGHIGRNETGAPAKDVSVILAPVGLAFRSELEAPAPQCKF